MTQPRPAKVINTVRASGYIRRLHAGHTIRPCALPPWPSPSRPHVHVASLPDVLRRLARLPVDVPVDVHGPLPAGSIPPGGPLAATRLRQGSSIEPEVVSECSEGRGAFGANTQRPDARHQRLRRIFLTLIQKH